MIQSYKDLAVWQQSMELVKEVYVLVKKLPREETYALSDQMRRAVVSIPSNIAEGFGRNAPGDFIRFLNIARGSKYEVETQIEICIQLGYFSLEEAAAAYSLCESTGKMLNSMINKIAHSHK